MAGALLRGGGSLSGAMPEIHLPVFEGPLHLLLRLIERDDLDITAVSLVAVTDQYLGAIRDRGGVDPQALAEFVAIGAKLIYLKSRALLPRPSDEAADLEDDEVGRELVDLLREYKRFGAVVEMLAERQESGLRFYPRMAPAPIIPEGPGLEGVTLEVLCKVMFDVLARKPAAPRAILPRDTTMTVAQRISDLRERLRRHGMFSFRRLISACNTRLEVIVSFMAILELLRGGECDARQSAAWGDIEVVALAPVVA